MAVFQVDKGRPVRCQCAADNAEIEIPGVGRYQATFHGFMEVSPQEEINVDGRAVIPLRITGHDTVGVGEGLGRITVTHDFDRSAPLSELRQLGDEDAFPATQVMYVNIRVTLGALPGVTLRNAEIGTLRNEIQNAFPPQDALYELQAPIDLEDIANPGSTVARILSYRARINPPKRDGADAPTQ